MSVIITIMDSDGYINIFHLKVVELLAVWIDHRFSMIACVNALNRSDANSLLPECELLI